MTTCQTLENLPSTILLDVIQYLSPIDRYRAMHDLNGKLNGIVRHGTTHINLSKIESKDDFNYYLKTILPDVMNYLRSLKISNDFLFDKEHLAIDRQATAIMFGIIQKVQAQIDLKAYEKLEELVLENITGSQLQLISAKWIHMSQLKRVIISFYGLTSDACKSVFNNDVIRPILKKLKLTLIDANVLFSQMTIDQTLPNLEHFTVDSCRVQNLPLLFPLAQNITHFKIHIWDFPNQRQPSLTENLKLPNLTHLKLTVDKIEWPFLEYLLKQCGEKLQYFTFLANGNVDFINSRKWERLITSHLKQLIKFNFHIAFERETINDIGLASFNTDVWHQLNVYVACHVNKGSFEEDGNSVHVYTLPLCNPSLITTTSAISVIAPSAKAPYKNVQKLTIMLDKRQFRDIKQFYENVDSIVLESFTAHRTNILPFLRMCVNPENICHLGFQSIRAVLKSQMFNQLLELCPNIYSLKIYSKILIEMTNQFSNEKMCLLLQKTIKHIQFNNSLAQQDFDNQTMVKFVQTFTNLERLFIHMESSADIMQQLSVIVLNMKVLNKIFIKSVTNIPNGFIDELREFIVNLAEGYIRKEKSFLVIWR